MAAAKNQVLKYEGDMRAWFINPSTFAHTPVIDDPTDIFGNLPLEVNATIFKYEAGDEKKVVSKRRGRDNLPIYSKQETGASLLSLTLVAVPAALFARIYYGEGADVSITGAAIVDEVVTFAADALSQPLAHTYLASTPTPEVTNTAGDTTYVVDVDYVIDRRHGRVRRLSTGAITATEAVKVSYTHTSFKLTRIRGGVKPQESFHLKGDYLNQTDQSDMRLTIHQANLSTEGDVDLFSEEPITVTLSGPLITPESETEPYIVELIEAAA